MQFNTIKCIFGSKPIYMILRQMVLNKIYWLCSQIGLSSDFILCKLIVMDGLTLREKVKDPQSKLFHKVLHVLNLMGNEITEFYFNFSLTLFSVNHFSRKNHNLDLLKLRDYDCSVWVGKIIQQGLLYQVSYFVGRRFLQCQIVVNELETFLRVNSKIAKSHHLIF